MSGRRHKANRRADRLAAQTAYVTRFMTAYIAELRSILKRAWPGYVRRHPDTRGPCHSCAFNPGTDTWTGFEKTVGSSQRSVQLWPVSMVNKSSIVSDLRGWRTPSVSGEELQAPGKSVPPGITRGLPVPRG